MKVHAHLVPARLRLTASLALLALALGGCKKDGDAPAVVCTAEDEKADCQPAPFSATPLGEAAPPSLDKMLETSAPAASAVAVVTATGGMATMADGLRLVIPAGALPAGARVDVTRHDLSPTLYRFKSSMPLTGKVDITFPVPGVMDGATPTDVYVLWFHDNALAPKALTGTLDAVAKTITVSTTEFSSGVPVNAKTIAAGTGDVITKMPYYNQGQTQNCWSMALLMLMVGYGAEIEPWDINAFFKLSTEHGLSYWGYNHSSDIVTFIKSKLPAVEVERKSWWTGFTSTDLRTYLTNNMRAARPTMVWYESPALHMVLFLGIEGDKFVIHDPAQGVYVRETWEMIEPRFKNSLFDGTGTLSFKTPAPGTAWNASLIIPFAAARNNGVDFIATKADGRFDTESAMVFSWYVPLLKGPGLLNLTTSMPGTLTDKHHAFAAVNVTNIVDGTAPRSLSVGFEIKSGTTVVYSHPETTVSVAGRADQDVSLIKGARGKPIKDFVKDAGDYTATFYVAEGTTRHDTVTIPFKVGKAAAPTTCGQLTSDFRGGCAKSGGCTCVGNAFCQGFQEGGVKSCDDAAKSCGLHCLVFDRGDCECDRYCTMFLSRIGC